MFGFGKKKPTVEEVMKEVVKKPWAFRLAACSVEWLGDAEYQVNEAEHEVYMGRGLYAQYRTLYEMRKDMHPKPAPKPKTDAGKIVETPRERKIEL
jgi:hypothetical protein